MAVKACSNIAILNVLARLGARFEYFSFGELERSPKEPVGDSEKGYVFPV